MTCRGIYLSYDRYMTTSIVRTKLVFISYRRDIWHPSALLIYRMCLYIISKLGGYYVRLKHLSCIIHIMSLLCHIMSLLCQLKHLQFFDYYVILCHVSKINYYINYVTSIMSIIFFEFIMSIMSIKT